MMQKRLRERRRLLWDAIKHQASNSEEGEGREEAELLVVRELMKMQIELQCGITRVESWARDAKKNGRKIVEEAKAYMKKKKDREGNAPEI